MHRSEKQRENEEKQKPTAKKKLPQIGHLQKRDRLSWVSFAPFQALFSPTEEDFVHALIAPRSSLLLLGANAAFTATKRRPESLRFGWGAQCIV